MKKLFFTFLISLSIFSYAQVPQEISYQGVARNASGSLLSNQNIGIKLDLHQGSAGGAVVFSETHNKTTNAFGLFTLGIGSANTVAFTAINWANGPYFLEVSMDPAGGTAYTSVGTQQFMSVPYALYAKTAGNAATYTAGAGINVTGTTISNTAPDQTVVLNATGATTVTGTYPNFTINTPTAQAYSAGNGIDITGGVISNTAAAVTPTIAGTGATTVTGTYPNLTINTPTIAPDQTVSLTGTGTATVTGAYPNFTVNVPSGASLPTAFNGQFLFNDGTIWDTLPRTKLFFDGTNFGVGTTAPQATFHVVGAGRFDASVSTPQIYANAMNLAVGTFTNAGDVLTNDGSGNATWQSVPAPILNYNNASNILTLTQGSAVTTATLTGTGSSTVSIVGSGLAAVSPTAGSSFTVSVPNPTIAIANGSISISNGNSAAIPSPSLTINSNSLTINGPGGNTVILPVSTTYTNGSGISITSGSVITNTVPDQTITLNGTGATSVTGTYPNFTINSPTVAAATTPTIIGTGATTVTSSGNTFTVNTPASQTYTNGAGISITSGSIITNTAPNQTITLNGTGATSVTGTYPNFTVTSPTTAVTSITQGANVIVSASASNYTVSAPAYSISIPGGNVVQITNGVSTSTSAINATSLTLSGTKNNLLSAGGNTVALNTYTSGTGITVAGTAPNYTLSSPNQSLSVSGNSLSITGANTVTIPTTSVVAGNANIIVNQSGNTFSVSSIAPPLSLNGTTLTSGPATNSVSLSSLAVWSNSVGVLYPTTLTNSVGVGTSGPLTDKMEINYASSSANTHLHLKQTGADAFSRIKFTNAVAPSKFWLSTVTSEASDANSRYNFFYNNGSVGHNIFTVGGDGLVSVNPFGTMNNARLYVGGKAKIDSSLTMAAYMSQPTLSPANEGRIYYDRANQKFKVSENGLPYVDMIGGGGTSPWLQSPGRVTLNNLSDSVGIGTSAPTSLLHVSGTFDPIQITVENGGGNFKTGYHIKTALSEWFMGQDGSSTTGFRITDRLAAEVRLQIDLLGRVGIGTVFASERLHVNGNIKLDSSLMVTGLTAVPPTSNGGNGRIFFDQISGKFKVSENGGPYVDMISGGTSPWIQGAGIVTQSIIGDKVGIGTGAPSSILDIQNSYSNGGGTAVNIAASSSSSSGANSAVYSDLNGSSTGNYVSGYFRSASVSGGTGNITGVKGLAVGSSGTYGIAVGLDGNGQGANQNYGLSAFAVGNVGVTNYGIYTEASSVGTNYALYAVANGTTGTSYAGYFNGAVYTKGITSTTSGFALRVQNSSNTELFNVRNDGNVGIGTTAPSAKLDVINTGSVSSAGRFENNSTSNSADAVFAKTDGAGAAIHAINGPPVAGGTNVGLWLENGHIKATASGTNTIGSGGTNITGPIITRTPATGFTTNDVSGAVNINFSSATNITSGQYVEFRVTFLKPYTVKPKVVASCQTYPFLVYISSTSLTDCQIVIYNPGATISSVSNVIVNYFIIE